MYRRNSRLKRREEENYKVVIIGDANVGKSTLVYRLQKGEYKTDLSSTVGMAFSTYDISLDSLPQGVLENESNAQVKLDIWDSAGQERYNSLIPLYYKSSQAILLCYDITSPLSQDNLIKKWLKNVKDFYYEKRLPALFLVGTKYDLVKDDEEKYVSANFTKLMESIKHSLTENSKRDIHLHLHGFLTSSLTGQNVPQLFQQVALVLHKTNGPSTLQSSIIYLGSENKEFSEEEKQSSLCCY